MKSWIVPTSVALSAVALIGAMVFDAYDTAMKQKFGAAPCQLSLPEMVQRVAEHKLCSIRQFENHSVDWVVNDLQLIFTGEFYTTDYQNWNIAVFPEQEEGCHCLPEPKPFQHYRIKGKLGEVEHGKLIIHNATVTETNESMDAEAKD